MEKPTLAIIGAGNMGTSILRGLIQTAYPFDKLCISNPHWDDMKAIQADFPQIMCKTDNRQVATAEVIVLAVKPNQIVPVLHEIQAELQGRRCLLISIAAGIRLDTLAKAVPQQTPLVRAMPNLAAQVGASATGLIHNEWVNDKERDLAETIMRSVGTVVWCQDDAQLDAVTAIAGSGPAYFFYLMELMEAAALEMGLSQAQARMFVLQTAEGAAKLAMTADESPKDLRHRVTSKGGTTAAAFEFLTRPAFRDTLRGALINARDRAVEIANEQG